MRIILDTNILRNDYFFNSYQFRILQDFARKTFSTIVIPEIVFDELVALYKRDLLFHEGNILKSQNKLESLLEGTNIHFEKLKFNIDEAVKEYIEYIKNRLGKINAEIPEYQDLFLKEVVRRSNERIKPISDKGEEFRDAILWLTILDYLKKARFDEAVFISNNTRDFADVTHTYLHQQLQDDLKSQNSTLTYYKSLNDFIDYRVNEIIFISKEWLVDHLNWAKLNDDAPLAVEGINATCFYEYYYRSNFDENDVEYWDVISASFKKDASDFFVYKPDSSDLYSVEIHLEGVCTIRFINDRQKFTDREVEFFTNIYLSMKAGNIIGYSGYYEEDSMLCLPD